MNNTYNYASCEHHAISNNIKKFRRQTHIRASKNVSESVKFYKLQNYITKPEVYDLLNKLKETGVWQKLLDYIFYI